MRAVPLPIEMLLAEHPLVDVAPRPLQLLVRSPAASVRLREERLGAVIARVPAHAAGGFVNTVGALTIPNDSPMAIARTAAEVRQFHRGGRIAVLLSAIAPVDALVADEIVPLERAGVRIVAVTVPDRDDHTPAVGDAIVALQRHGIVVDIAALGPRDAARALDAARTPLLVSAAGSRDLVPHPRNLDDELLSRIAAAGGVVHVTSDPARVSLRALEQVGRQGGDREAIVVTLDDVLRQLRHLRDVVGVAHLGLSGAVGGRHPSVLAGTGVALPRLLAALSDLGWSRAELAAVAGGNALRLLHDSERLAAERARPVTALG